MSKIPVERNSQVQHQSKFYNSHGKFPPNNVINTLNHNHKNLDVNKSDAVSAVKESKAEKTDEKRISNYRRSFTSLIPKMSLNLEKVVEQNPRILDLRQKLNEITKKQDRNVDKQTKALINNITQQLDDKDEDDSGPYSLLFELQSQPSTSKEPFNSTTDTKVENDSKRKDAVEQCQKNISISNKSMDRLPNVINFDEKPMKEYEYSCENELNLPAKKFNVHSRSDLCLHFKPQVQNRIENLSPNENSLTKPNEENSLDDSLGILTPDQMDDICYLENAFSPTVEGLPIFCDNELKNSPDNGDTPSTDKTESNSAASTMFLQNDIIPCDINTKIEMIPDINLQINGEDMTGIPEQDEVVNSVEPNQIINECVENQNKMDVPNDCIISVKEELISCFLEDELLPSIHSSILEPVSSVADTTVNLDLPLDCKHNENRLSCQRIEQTPSPEELPLDNSEVNGEISTYSNSQFSTSTLHDSQTYSDIKNEFTKSIENSKVSNSFITSITSITSLDGYQGDGEMSRPVSRGADHSIGPREDIIEMDWQNVPVTRRADPMTDSDFFTESDADGLDDHIHRGDRRAQVIDGALYGGKNNNGNPPLLVNRSEDSCMDSSGVYTDFENHRSSPVFLNAIDDMSPDGSSPSTHSECSQKNCSGGQVNGLFTPLDNTLKSESNMIDNDETSKNNSKRNSLNSIKENNKSDKIIKEEKRSFTLKKYKMPKRDVPSKLKTILANRKTDTENSIQCSPKTVKKNDRRENLAKKNSSNDTKNDYKMKSYKDIKSKVDCSFSLQRSQTACSVTRMLSSKSTNTNVKPKSRHMRMRMDIASANGSGKSSLHSSQSDISASSTPLGKHGAARFPLLRNGKKRESAPPQATPARAPPTPPQPPPTQAKKNGVVQKLASSPVSVRARASLAPPPSPRKPSVRRTPAQRPTTLPTNNKEPPRVTAAVGPRGKRQGPATPQGPPARASPAPAVPVSPPAPVTSPKAVEQAAALAHAAKGVEALGVLVQYLVFRLDGLNGGAWRAEATRWRGVAAAERGSAARADLDRQQRAQKDFDTIAECLNKISELEIEVNAKEEVNARLQAAGAAAEDKYRITLEDITSLAADIKGLKGTIESLKHEVAESRARLHAQSEIERTLRAQLDAARDELARGCDWHKSCDTSHHQSCDENKLSCDMTNDYSGFVAGLAVNSSQSGTDFEYCSRGELSNDANELAAEVRSLRAVLELKQAEAVSLRGARSELGAERERRAAAEREARAARHAAEELRERAAAKQRDAERLRDDNRRLREAAARDRDRAARLAALNEELRYKLRQKSQVVSLLAGGGYAERTLRTRTASSESARSASPAPDSPPSPASPAPGSPPPLPAVKGVVEKHDSVSWVLEIEETPEEVASRLARRSSFRAAAAGGVKRPGGSPAPASPASPASPAPNASKLFRPGDLDFPPAPPPLKESAGEAIYIYDDRRY